MKITPGSRWKSAVCTTEVVVVKASAAPAELGCGGQPMLSSQDGPGASGAPASGLDGGTELGKRYGDNELGPVLLCSKAGAGTLTCNGKPLAYIESKRLPSSD